MKARTQLKLFIGSNFIPFKVTISTTSIIAAAATPSVPMPAHILDYNE